MLRKVFKEMMWTEGRYEEADRGWYSRQRSLTMCAVPSEGKLMLIYLCCRKKGLQVDLSGMALSHGGNSAVSRISGVHTDLRMTV